MLTVFIKRLQNIPRINQSYVDRTTFCKEKLWMKADTAIVVRDVGSIRLCKTPLSKAKSEKPKIKIGGT